VVLALTALAVAATVDAVRGLGGTEAGPENGGLQSAAEADLGGGARLLSGPEVPPAGALPGGLLITTADGCKLRVVDFGESSVGGAGLETGCAVWVSPGAAFAAVVLPARRADGGTVPGDLGLVRLGKTPELVRELGALDGEVSWSRDGTRLAWCTPKGETIVHSVEDGLDRHVPGCGPRFVPDGSLLTAEAGPDGRLLRDGEVVLDQRDLRSGFDPGVDRGLEVLSWDESPDGLLAVAVLRLEAPGSRAVLELWQDGELLASVALPSRLGGERRRFGELVRFSPSGAVLAVGPAARSSEVVFVDLRLREPTLQIDDQRGFAWSPDGAWLAVALDDGIAVYSPNADKPVYRIPVRAAALDWLPVAAAGDGDG
jgi:hypothetical protein